MNRNDTSWNNVADWYDNLLTDPESYQQKVILPNIIRILGDVRGKRVLDLACGQGLFSEALARAGALVTGVDLSPELIRLAREKAGSVARFFIGSAEKFPKEVKGLEFDLGLCVLAFQNIRNIDKAIGEVAHVIKDGGRFLTVLNHPCFRIPGQSSWGFDEATDVQFRRLDTYLSESYRAVVMHPGEKKSPTTASFHRPLQLYFKLFSKHGFLVHRLEEWISPKESQRGPRKRAEDTARKEFPLFLALELEKNRER